LMEFNSEYDNHTYSLIIGKRRRVDSLTVFEYKKTSELFMAPMFFIDFNQKLNSIKSVFRHGLRREVRKSE
jgi:hypothetical protein